MKVHLWLKRLTDSLEWNAFSSSPPRLLFYAYLSAGNAEITVYDKTQQNIPQRKPNSRD